MDIVKVDNIVFRDLFVLFKDTITSPYFVAFFCLMITDIISGYTKAFKTKSFDSKTGTNGLLRHLNVILSIVVMGVLARIFQFRAVSVAWCVGFIVNYLGSVLENFEEMGIEFPEWLKPLAERMRRVNEKKLADTLAVDTLEIHKTEIITKDPD